MRGLQWDFALKKRLDSWNFGTEPIGSMYGIVTYNKQNIPYMGSYGDDCPFSFRFGDV